MEKIFDIQKIMSILPHRYPFIMIDRIIELVPGEKVVALKNVTPWARPVLCWRLNHWPKKNVVH